MSLSRGERYLVLSTAFLGWMFAGSIMSIIPLIGRSATISLGITQEDRVAEWFSLYIAAFLLGAAFGGLCFGWLGDHIGRARAMGLSIVWYSLFTGLAALVRSPGELLVLRFVACMGVGGIWPNGVSLASEAWSNASRPLLAGLIGTAANIGFVLVSLASYVKEVTPESWRWLFWLCSTPIVLGFFVLALVPESPHWVVQRAATTTPTLPIAEVFRPPLLKLTLLGILLGAIPLLGNWGGANWLVPWAGKVGDAADPYLKSWTQASKSTGAAIGSLLGGWLAAWFGRRTCYFLISLCSLATSVYLFYFLTPADSYFLIWVFILGFFGTIYFGWLPLYLPELFPTRARATGTGVTFNFGRVLTAAGVLVAGQIVRYYAGDYAKIGQITCLVYLAGMLVIFAAPDTSNRAMEE